MRPSATHEFLIGGSVGVSEILAQIDREIAQLQQAKALLTGSAAPVAKRKPGRPKKVVAVVPKKAAAVAPAVKKPAWLGLLPRRS